MMCAECDYTPPWDDEDLKYCPHCGEEWREKTLSDVDWPITVQAGPRINIAKHVRLETGVEAAFNAFTDDCEVLIDLVIHQDGTVEISDVQ